MISAAQALYQAKYHPFQYADILASFYQHLEQVPQNLLLLQLLIPLYSQPQMRKAFENSNKKSVLYSIFQGKDQTSKKSRQYYLRDLQQRIEHFQATSLQALQYCVIKQWLVVDSHQLEIQPAWQPSTHRKGCSPPWRIEKSMKNLALRMSHHSIMDIYQLLGVRPCTATSMNSV